MPGRILLVEDDEILLRGLQRLLSRHFIVDAACDAETADSHLLERRYDGVVTDMDLPDHDGLWLLERAKERCPQALRILMSGRSVSLEGRPVDAFVRKPATVEQLLDVLRI